jgi:hypothetical protein
MSRLAIRLAVLVLAVLSLTRIPFLVIGLWSRVTGRGPRSVFFCYAGSRDFVASYGLGRTAEFFRWQPSPIGVLSQAGDWGLVLASPVTERDFLDPANQASFRRLLDRISRIARLCGARDINLAGILPGVIAGAFPIDARDSRPIVIRALIAAIAELSETRLAGFPPPIILFGGAGRIGRALRQAPEMARATLYVVDPAEGASASLSDLRHKLGGGPVLLVDLSRKGALAASADQLWPGSVVLNETFPRPSRALVARLAARGVEVWHLSGLAGRVWPELPHGYEDAVPCCAAHEAGPNPKVRLVRLDSAGRAQPRTRGSRVS